MKVIIIEDEYPNVLRLQKLLLELDSQIEILTDLDSVQQSVQYIQTHPDIDLLFLDIQLTDGLGLEIFEQTNCNIPVIFTTAYDQYAIDAFKYLSVDYLLKPIKTVDLKKSLDKFNKNFNQKKPLPFSTDQLVQLLDTKQHPTTFICRRGKNQYPIRTDQIACFYFEDRTTWAKTVDNQDFHLAKTLDELEQNLNPKHFFRANRKVICAKHGVEKFEMLPKSKAKLILQPKPTFEIIISSEKSAAFKSWLSS